MSLRIKLYRVGVIIARAARYFGRDDGAALAGYMAYTALLALFPFLIFATALSGLLIGSEGLTPVIDFLFEAMPVHVARTLQPVLTEVVANRSGSVLGLSALGAIWIASNGFEALRVGLERAYGTRGLRPFWKTRLIAIAFVLCAVIAFFLLAILIVFGPSLGALAQELIGLDDESLNFAPTIVGRMREFIGMNEGSLNLWNWFRYGTGAVILAVFLVACHWFLPGRRPGVPIFRGVAFTIVLWMLLASAFSIYFRFAPNYAVTYGTLGGVIATLLFFYVSSAIFIFGAEINSASGAGEERDNAPRQEDDEATSAPLF